MKTAIYIMTGIILFSLVSCSDFLEPKSQSEYIPKDVNALQEMLIGSAYPKHGGNTLLAFLSFFDDDVQFHKTNYEFNTNVLGDIEAKKAVYTWQPDMFFIMEKNNYNIQNIWEGYYNYILGANAALDYINEVNGTAAEKNYVIAQALGLRAFYYFMLVNHFGAPYNYNKQALGVPLKLNSNLLPEDQLLMERNSVEEVYNQIITDLNESERLFLTLSKDKQYEPNYLVSLPMIQLLKSRIFLYMENWKEAVIYAQKVINDWSFSLINLNGLPSPSIAEPYYNFTSLKSSEVIWLYGKISDLTVFNDETVSYEEDSYFGKITHYRKAFIASDDLIESFQDGDLRKEKYIAKEYDKDNNVFFEDSYSSFGKYKISAVGEPNGSENFALSFRLSEAYLNLAEAAAHNNDEKTALSTLKTLLENRYEPEKFVEPSGLTGEALKTFIKDERRKELCFEGQRWFDLRRYGMPQIIHKWGEQVYTLKQNDLSYTMPIPDAILLKNKKLEQNPLAPKREN
ncbi:RagB/SusD family nutrient uptake outer membrane protein [Bacteroides finegoldii]|uniref:RagB/SusD family nutrient uptake outer membrane protein n=2 Tax=Bacteroides finegoldii TaxID=338188 RepID=UPI0018A09423|nr:RagB/SusD family nutrient uptake outer membrane protein [Bacteroides finegoldii]